jgi:O-antigen/teichoic acid export membrane protein
MQDFKQGEKLYSNKLVAKNTTYNLLGYGIPLVLAIIFIPMLIKQLGYEKFGILNLAWVVIGYFSFLDFGIGKSLTKIIAEKIGLNKQQEIPEYFWTSLILMLGFSIVVSFFLFLAVPYLVNNFFKITDELKIESSNAFYALVVSIPIVTTTAGLRGVLEAYQKFGIINVLRTILGGFTFITPLICLIFTNSLFWIVISLIILRSIIWILYFLACIKVNPKFKSKVIFNTDLFKDVIKLSSWITVSNIIGPLFIYLDRFLIGAIISVSAITYYATPYEVITKLLLIPGALVGVLFPIFSATYIKDPAFSKSLFKRGIKFIFLLLYPIILIIISFAFEGMNLWVGADFANNSTFILQMLSFGVLVLSVAYVPFHFLQGIGRPDIPAIVNLVELPFYLLILWYALVNYGINGAAFVWTIRIIIDASLLIYFSRKVVKNIIDFKLVFNFILLVCVLIIPLVIDAFLFRVSFAASTIFIFLILSWSYFLENEEKEFLLAKLKLSFNKKNI